MNRFIRNYRADLFLDAQRFDAVDATGNISDAARDRLNRQLERSNTPLSPGDRHVWDFTPVILDEKLIGFTYLNADISTVKDDQHHFVAQMGFAETTDFVNILWKNHAALTPSINEWDNTSIWSNYVLRHEGEWLLFYTSRDGSVGDGMTQSVGLAVSKNLVNWERITDFKIDADPRWYTTESLSGDPTIHSWRDPYLFTYNGDWYMVLSAKDKNKPIGKNGCVALLKAADNSLRNWDALPPLVSPGSFSEMEEAEIHQDDKGEWVVTFSSWAKYDYATGRGGFLAIPLGDDIAAVNVGEVVCPLPESSGLYACHVIPELPGNEIVGFDIEKGGIRRSGVFTSLLRPFKV